MVDCDLGDLVCLYLDAHGGDPPSPAPRDLTAAGIGDALELGDTAASRVELLDELASLQETDLVTEAEQPVVGYDAPRPIYTITDAGRSRAAGIRDQVREETVVVTNGTTEAVPLGEIDRYFEDVTAPLATALSRLTDNDRVPLDRHLGDRFVDRKQALATVRKTIGESFLRECQTVLVSGPAGLGKTALVREALDRVRADHDEFVLARGDVPPGPTGSYEPIRQAFEDVPDDGTLLATLREARDAHTPEAGDAVSARRTALFNRIADDLRAAADSQPLVVYLDNLHRASEATLSLFAHLATTIEALVDRIAFVGTYRTPAVAAADHHPLEDALDRLEDGSALTEVRLDDLERPDTRALLATVLDRHDLPEPFVRLVQEQTGGNPLFIRETATHLLETGQVDPAGGAFPTDPAELSFPGEVTEQIDQRLAQLDETSRDLLRIGALIGEYVPGRVLAAATDLPEARFREYVDVLIVSRIWTATSASGPDGRPKDDTGPDGRPRDDTGPDGTKSVLGQVVADGSGDLRFVSGGLREAVVDRLPDRAAASYHERVAEAFVTVDDEAGDRHAARIAHHYDEAGEVERARTYYRRAGDHAKDAYAHEAALERYERALALARRAGTDDRELASLLGDVADVARTVGELDEARELAREGLAAAPDRSRERCRLLGLLSAAHHGQGEYDGVREIASHQRDLAADLGIRGHEADANNRLGLAAQYQGDYAEAREYHERALELARGGNDRRREADTLQNLGTLAARRTDPERAREYLQEALVIAGDIDARLTTVEIDNVLGIVAEREGEYAEARERYESALALARELDDRQNEANVLGNLGLVARFQGDFDAARDHHERSLELARELGDRQGEVNSLGNLGAVHRLRGAHEQAREYHERALDLARELEVPEVEMTSLIELGELNRLDGEYDRAASYLDEVWERLDDEDDPNLVGVASLRRAALALSRGELDVARRRATSARETFEEIEMAHLRARSRRMLGRIAAESGDTEAARNHWRVALETFEGRNAPHDALETLEYLVDSCTQADEDDRAREYLERARETLADAPAATARRHREWFKRGIDASDG